MVSLTIVQVLKIMNLHYSIDSLYLYIYIIFDQLIVNYVCVIISDRTTIFNSRKKQLRKSSI